MFLLSKTNTAKIISLIGVLVLFLACASPALASPSTLSQKRQAAQQVKAQIEEIDSELEVAVEEYNLANLRLEETEKEILQNERELEKASLRLKKYQRNLNQRIVGIYKQDKSSLISVLLSSENFDSFLAKLDFLIRISSQDASFIKKVKTLKEEIEKRKEKLEKEKEKRLALKEEAQKKKEEIEAKISERKRFLASIEADIRRLLEEEAERETRRNRITLPPSSPRPSTPGNDSSSGSSEGTSSGGRRDVVSIALSYLGVPYVYGGASPETGFDCSGFTMYVYRQVGIYLPHYSAWQYRYGTPVSYNELQPGDLVFFGRNGTISHVGIYIGSGKYVHAPHTGDVVKVSSLAARSDYICACRLL